MNLLATGRIHVSAHPFMSVKMLDYVVTTWAPDGLHTSLLKAHDPLSAGLAHCAERFAPYWPEQGKDWGCDPFGYPFDSASLGDLEHYLCFRDTIIVVYQLLQSRELERVNPE
jgi:hypothetical protein